MNLDTRRLKTLDEVRAFLAGTSQFEFTMADRLQAYRWIEATLRQLLLIYSLRPGGSRQNIRSTTN